MQVPEEPGYFGSFMCALACLNCRVCPDDVRLVPTPKRQPEYAHVASLDGSDTASSKFPRPNAKRYGGCVARAPASRRPNTRSGARPSRQLRNPGEVFPAKPKSQKRFAILDPLIEESVHRSLSQQDRLSCIRTPTKVHQSPQPSPSSSRNRGARRSLSRFTKELERYCMAASTNGTPPLPPSTPTVSESLTTLNTVAELAPYHKQFRAAGLAVTSREQMADLANSKYERLQSLGLQRARYPAGTRFQMDGSTVTPSEEDSAPKEPAGPAVIDQRKELPVPNAIESRPSTGTKSFVPPWLRKKDTPNSKTPHSGRKFSNNHIHPSQAMTVEPLLTPVGGIIDSYFDVREPTAEQNGQFNTPKVSITTPPSARPSAAPSARESPVDKPLPKQPQVERRPVPTRKERRHMENTSQWPTAGVVIHDKPARLPSQDQEAIAASNEPAPVQMGYPGSARSWKTKEETVLKTPHGAPSLPSKDVDYGERNVLDPPQSSPPVPPKDTVSPKGTPDGPQKHIEDQQSGHQASHCLKLGKSLHTQWHKAAALRHGRHHKDLPSPPIVPPEAQVYRDKPEARAQESIQTQDASSSAPQLPPTWQLAVKSSSSSSFEKALDAVIQKLDAMEDRRQYERASEMEEYRKSLAHTEALDPLSRATSSKPPVQPLAETHGPPPESHPSSNDATEHSDRNISDKDILLGLKMAICAACDEDLDAWIRIKTGLRLRRFLADLKAFDSVSNERRAPATQPLSRQIRRNAGEERRLQAEKVRKRRSTTARKAPWAPCFGVDGQASVTEFREEALFIPETRGQS